MGHAFSLGHFLGFKTQNINYNYVVSPMRAGPHMLPSRLPQPSSILKGRTVTCLGERTPVTTLFRHDTVTSSHFRLFLRMQKNAANKIVNK